MSNGNRTKLSELYHSFVKYTMFFVEIGYSLPKIFILHIYHFHTTIDNPFQIWFSK